MRAKYNPRLPFFYTAIVAATILCQVSDLRGQPTSPVSSRVTPAAREDQTLRTAPNVSTRCAPGELLVKWKDGPDSPTATLGNAQIGSTVQRNFHEIGWQQVKLPCELSVQEGIARYRALASVSAVEPNYALAPILPPRRKATDPVAGVGNTGVPPSVEDGAPGSDDQLPTPHSALRT